MSPLLDALFYRAAAWIVGLLGDAISEPKPDNIAIAMADALRATPPEEGERWFVEHRSNVRVGSIGGCRALQVFWKEDPLLFLICLAQALSHVTCMFVCLQN
jgi:hypothetical protein